MSSRASISHKLRLTHSGHRASGRPFASGISCQPSGLMPCRRVSEVPQDEQNTLLRRFSGRSVIETRPLLPEDPRLSHPLLGVGPPCVREPCLMRPYWPRLSAISTRAISTRRAASALSSDCSSARRLASSSLRLASATSMSPSSSASSAKTMTW